MDTKRLNHCGQWAQATFGGCALGDRRRTKRLVKTATHLSRRPEASLSTACTSEADRLAAHRLIENDMIEPQAISEGGFAASVEQASDCPVILAASDTTAVAFAHAGVREELGDIGGPSRSVKRGYLVHSSLLIDARDERTLGLIDQHWWQRDLNQRGRKHERKQRQYTEKESYKWERTSRHIEQRMGSLMDRVIELTDAEADVYEFLAYKQAQQHRFVTRISQNRALSDTDQRLWDHLAEQPEIARLQVHVPQRGGRKAREATLSLRAATMALRPPHRRDGALPAITLSAVLVQEIDAPANVTPLCWRLYTSEPIATAQQVQQVVDYYRCRWRVEEFHRAWKSGCKLEASRQQSDANLQRIGRMLAFVAVRLLQLREQARYRPDTPCDQTLSTAQWQCLWLSSEEKPPPRQPPTARWAFYALARLGGFYDSKRTGRVGPEALHRGWQRLQDQLIGYRLAQNAPEL
jgi:hypothetical protein